MNLSELPAITIFLAIFILTISCLATKEIFSKILLCNAIASLVMSFILCLSYAQNNYTLLDIIMIYALTSFVSMIGYLKYYQQVRDHE